MSTEIIVLIILFNVATAYYKHRVKKKKEMEARNGASSRAASTTSTATEEYTSSSSNGQKAAQVKREPPSWASEHERDEVEQDWDETNQSEYDEEDSENPYRENSRPKPSPIKSEPPKAVVKSPEPETGKDLLTQLARELGLEIPTRSKPNPTSESQPNRTPALGTKGNSTATQTSAKEAASEILRNRRANAGYDDHGRTVADSAPGMDMTSAPGIAAVESANASAYVTRDHRRNANLTGIHADLFDGESLKRAFILKTILDQPLSLKPHGPGRGQGAMP